MEQRTTNNALQTTFCANFSRKAYTITCYPNTQNLLDVQIHEEGFNTPNKRNDV